MLNKEVKSKEELRIIYMGTPEFAVPALEKLLEACWYGLFWKKNQNKVSSQTKNIKAKL